MAIGTRYAPPIRGSRHPSSTRRDATTWLQTCPAACKSPKPASNIQTPLFARRPTLFATKGSSRCTRMKSARAVATDLTVSSLLFPNNKLPNAGASSSVTATCEVDEFCYVEAARIEQFLNSVTVWEALAPPKEVTSYTVESSNVVKAFHTTPEGMTSSSEHVVFLLSRGINFLAYQGNLDLACNTAGTLRWAEALRWKGQPEFASKSLRPWTALGTDRSEPLGATKEVNVPVGDDGHTVRFAFVTVDGAGHLVRLLSSHSFLFCFCVEAGWEGNIKY